jgi:hypothetical protein
MATEKLSWGYKPIFGELKKLGISVGLTTSGDIIEPSDCPPPPEKTKRKPNLPWSKFVIAHIESLVASDFFTKPSLYPAQQVQRLLERGRCGLHPYPSESAAGRRIARCTLGRLPALGVDILAPTEQTAEQGNLVVGGEMGWGWCGFGWGGDGFRDGRFFPGDAVLGQMFLEAGVLLTQTPQSILFATRYHLL